MVHCIIFRLSIDISGLKMHQRGSVGRMMGYRDSPPVHPSYETGLGDNACCKEAPLAHGMYRLGWLES